MADITNKKLALLVLAALVVVVLATTIQLNKLNDFGPVGFASSNDDYGTVVLNIAESLNIQVDAVENSIDFGTCTPMQTGVAQVDSNNSVSNITVCSGTAASTYDFIEVDNIGNVHARINVSAECLNTSWLPENDPDNNAFEIKTGGGCTGTGQATYAHLNTGEISACTNLTSGSSFRLWARVKIDSDTLTSGVCGADTTNTLTFHADDSPN